MASRFVSTNILRNSYSVKKYFFSEACRAYRTSSFLQGGHKSVFRQNISKNLEIICNDILKIENRGANQLPLVNFDHNRPLVILLPWLFAQRKHVDKYIDLYLGKGFDVLKLSITMKQILWPTRGSQLAAHDAVDFLYENRRFTPLLVHGFSVGGYVWGEVLVHMNRDLERYRGIIDRIKGQIWDSPPDTATHISKGLSHAIFPNNALLRKAMEKGLDYHLRTFHERATQHYLRSRQIFLKTPVGAPALIFIDKNDPMSPLTSATQAQETWESMGMKTYMKCWDKSRHVSHFLLHRKEYLETLENFLSEIEEINSNTQSILDKGEENTKIKAQI